MTNQVKFYDLNENEFPMLGAMKVLVMSLSCFEQSALGTEAAYTLEQWQEIDTALAGMNAYEYMRFVLGNVNPKMLENPLVAEFNKSWV